MNNNEASGILVEINDSLFPEALEFAQVEKLVKYTCQKFSLEDAQVSIGIVDDAQMQRVHKDFLSDPTTTDVMSFDLSDELCESKIFEIVVNADLAKRKSEMLAHSFEAELLLYVLHGLLHNIGFDDLSDVEFKKMHAAEDEIMQALGWGVIYAKKSK